ncbi:unnamed protein product [Cylicostephanus goldi]|uniref:Retrotransposon gag domain-containing protein n=1 Tax=Cylicostephanus goldi TaxID=71465 RepID=A0A3P7M2U8_CYLGO|nr:unnamed protein product [Cylicostephanus goldi]
MDVREGTFQDFMTAFKVIFNENGSANRMEAYVSLKNLSSWTISEYCARLEQLTRAAYPESAERELSMLHTGELIAQFPE